MAEWRAGRETEHLHPASRSRSVGADALSRGLQDAEWEYCLYARLRGLGRRNGTERGPQTYFIVGTPGLTEISLFTGYIIAIWIALSSSVILQNAWILRTLQVCQILLFRRAEPNRELLVLLPRTHLADTNTLYTSSSSTIRSSSPPGTTSRHALVRPLRQDLLTPSPARTGISFTQRSELVSSCGLPICSMTCTTFR